MTASHANITLANISWPLKAFIAAALLISGAAAYAAFAELFIAVINVSVPRVIFTPPDQSSYNAISVQFFIDTPTICWALILLSALLCMVKIVAIVFRLFGNRNESKINFAHVCFYLLLQLVAYAVIIVDMLGSAGDFA